MVAKIEKGSAVRLLEAHEHIEAGTVGIANAVVHVDKTYIWFMPSTEFAIYVLDAKRFELIPDDVAQEMGFEELIPELPEEMKVDEDDTVLNYDFGE